MPYILIIIVEKTLLNSKRYLFESDSIIGVVELQTSRIFHNCIFTVARNLWIFLNTIHPSACHCHRLLKPRGGKEKWGTVFSETFLESKRLDWLLGSSHSLKKAKRKSPNGPIANLCFWCNNDHRKVSILESLQVHNYNVCINKIICKNVLQYFSNWWKKNLAWGNFSNHC